MVATAASPVGTDDVRVEILVGEGAKLAVRSVAAGIAWSSTASRQHFVADVGPSATLDWAPEPLIVTERCDHRMDASITVAPGATLWWAERIVLGRHGETPGSL
ncbi:MAG: urease accessory protein UreD, partial [Acidimicrobiales bacterium]